MNKFMLSTIIAIIVAFFVFSVPVYADEYDEYEPDPVQDEFIQEQDLLPEVVTELPVTAAPELDTNPVTYNFAVNAALSELKSCLVISASDQDTEISFPDNFDIDVSNYIDIILIQNGNPELFRSAFISLILSELGITPDNPLYDLLYDELGKFYDDMTGLSQQHNNEAAATLAVCALGSISLLGFIKWVI